MAVERWWDGDADEIYWVEVTQRDDLGADLRAPQENHAGLEYWSYSLVCEVDDGDIVFHYSKHDHAIRLWSRAAGGWWQDDIYWGARGTVGRSSDPYDRPGWCHGLDGPFELPKAITLADLRASEPAIRAARDDLLDAAGSPLYFPFEVGDRRPLRAAQGYLFKLPAAVVRAFPALASADTRPAPEVTPRPAEIDSVLGLEYRRPDEELSASERDPFEVDPAVVERGVRGHARAQNQLHDHLDRLGIKGRSPSSREPAFDLAWESGGVTWVAEVKSVTVQNEERQLRLGVGQLLRYRHLLSLGGRDARAVLMAERKPQDQTWDELCVSLGIVLVWPQVLMARLPSTTTTSGMRR